MPENLKKFLIEKGLEKYNDMPLFFIEWVLKPNDFVYVIGTAKKIDVFLNRIKELKRDPQMKNNVDIDGNGIVTTEEWDYFVNKIKQKVYEELTQSAQKDHLTDVVICKSKTDNIFLISNRSEKEVTQVFLRRSYFTMGFGSFFILVGLFLLVILVLMIK